MLLPVIFAVIVYIPMMGMGAFLRICSIWYHIPISVIHEVHLKADFVVFIDIYRVNYHCAITLDTCNDIYRFFRVGVHYILALFYISFLQKDLMAVYTHIRVYMRPLGVRHAAIALAV